MNCKTGRITQSSYRIVWINVRIFCRLSDRNLSNIMDQQRCRTAEHRISSTRIPAASCRTLLRDEYLSLTFANQEVDIIKPTRCRASLYKNQAKDQFPTDSFRLKRLDQIHSDKKILKTFIVETVGRQNFETPNFPWHSIPRA